MSVVVGALLSVMFNSLIPISPHDEGAARLLIKIMDEINEETEYLALKARYDYFANMTDFNLENMYKYTSKYARSSNQRWQKLKTFKWREFKDQTLKRQFSKMSKRFGGDKFIEYVPEEDEVSDELEDFEGFGSRDDMFKIQITTKLCDYKNSSNCELRLDPDLKNIMAKSQDPKELEYYWKAWRDATGKKLIKTFRFYLMEENYEAQERNFRNMAERTLDEFESDTIEQHFLDLLHSIEPLYNELHAYVRGKLNQLYGDQVVSKDGPIPEHILGHVAPITWSGNFGVMPYPKYLLSHVTHQMIKQNYTPVKMYQLADAFFVSLNMSAVPETFWKYSILEKPKDNRTVRCHGSAFDLQNRKDFRIMMCTLVKMEELLDTFHEMGHIQYAMQFKHQPRFFRAGANSGFDEAIGDVIALSASTPQYLKRIGLLSQDFVMDEETHINYLLSEAMRKIARMPTILAAEKWIWDASRGKIKAKNFNCHFWKLRVKYSGIQPPVDRSAEDLDPLAIHHIAVGDPMISYFVSVVLELQIYKALCIAAGQYDPNNPNVKSLHNCDLHGSAAAGDLLSKALRLGASKPWPDTLEILTGSRKMLTDDLLEYYKPLHDWLKKENHLRGYKVGWGEPTVNICGKS